MFEALSKSKNIIVNAKDVFDMNEIFRCPNPNCPAELKIRSVNGKRAKHFFCGKNMTKHLSDCPFALSIDSTPTEFIDKYTLEEIYENAQIRDVATREKSTQENENALPNAAKASVHTPSQLLQFCLGHDLKTKFSDKMIVDDIILNSCNLQSEGRFKGVSGLRLIVGETIKFDNPTLSILFKVPAVSTTGKILTLFCTAFVSKELLNKVVKHYNGTYGNFGHHSIAVLEKWETDKKYNVSCQVKRDRNLVVRFKKQY